MIGLIETIKKLQVSLITGVPDSMLAGLISSLEDSELSDFIEVAPNEGNAVALAAGHYLGSGKPAIVYMQNSGLSNAINPLVSLAHKRMFGIPMILLVGWRGELSAKEIQVSDEPQHKIQGLITRKQLVDLGIPFYISGDNYQTFSEQLEKVYNESIELQSPVAILIRKGLFDSQDKKINNSKKLSSLEIIEKIVELSPENSILVGSTGMIGRELLKATQGKPEFNGRVILNVGAMGHVSALAKGIARTNPDKIVICFEGDGSLLMHLGSLALLNNLPNFKHILLNNKSHDSVGGQKTTLAAKNHRKIYGGISKKGYYKIEKLNYFSSKFISMKLLKSENCFIEFLCAPRLIGTNKELINAELPRPTRTPKQYGKSFREWIDSNS